MSFLAAELVAGVVGQVSLPPASDPLVRTILRVIGLIVGAFLASGVAALTYRWYTREVIPRALALLFGTSVVALYLNTVGLFGNFVTGSDTAVFQLDTVLFNTTALAGGALASPVGRLVGDRLATDVFAVAGAKELDADVSRLVRTVGRVTTVTIPEEIGDIEAYDPVSETIKTQLSGKTLLFPRRLTEDQLRERLVERVKDDHGVGHVDVEFEDGDVSYFALGSRAAGLGPTLAPGTVAVAIRADPGPGAAAGDPVQVWAVPNASDDTESDATTATTNGEETRIESDGSGSVPTRVAFGELRGVADDVATVALDEEDASKLTGADEYRVVTLPADPRVDREFASLLRSADETMAVTTVQPDAALDGGRVADVDTTVVAIRPANNPIDAIPARTRELRAGDTLYVIGRPEVLRKVERRAATDDNLTDGGEDEDGDTDTDGGDSVGAESATQSGAQSS
ncbi:MULTISPECIES: potassium transporter TrkA [Haloferax]|uniref:Potassium transporter TrkA n=2 Tax=Haloferax TaxID=2251 RepID=A0A6G1Z2J1_9EURY|nr:MULTISPECIES: potassium transporter TrkA [Haloferax]KAB1187962.1 potassium transporter TrkA [Haloferax sp. CBA1149]MRW80631.1 potassium transporter TrkA [Haloferax marinisediminis]